jgi:hypothetical protein
MNVLLKLLIDLSPRRHSGAMDAASLQPRLKLLVRRPKVPPPTYSAPQRMEEAANWGGKEENGLGRKGRRRIGESLGKG